MTDTDGPWPTDLEVAERGRVLKVAFEDGSRFELPAEYLRVMSPSAEVRGHSRAGSQTVGGKREVAIVAIEPIGTYAVRLVFDDTHATGLYTWTYLQGLGSNEASNWARYLADLDSKGLSRDKLSEIRHSTGGGAL